MLVQIWRAKVRNRSGSFLHLSDGERAECTLSPPAGLISQEIGRKNGAIGVQRDGCGLQC